MKKTLLLVAIIALALGGCGSKSRELAYKKVQCAELERYVSELEAQNAAKDAELEQLRRGGQVAPVATNTQPLPSGGIGQWGNQDKDITVSIGSDILFKPGSSILSTEAKKGLDRIASDIKGQYPNAKIRVEGHTDSQPIKRSKDENKDNWDLSGNRAQAVLHYLAEQGIAEEKLGFAGYGMVDPVASNSSKDGMAKNRRVKIVVITNK
jgi:chemotaxis protein MotB